MGQPAHRAQRPGLGGRRSPHPHSGRARRVDRAPGLVEAIASGSLVAIDTMAFIYRVETSPGYASIVEPFFSALARGTFHAITSVITLMEITVGPLRNE